MPRAQTLQAGVAGQLHQRAMPRLLLLHSAAANILFRSRNDFCRLRASACKKRWSCVARVRCGDGDGGCRQLLSSAVGLSYFTPQLVYLP